MFFLLRRSQYLNMSINDKDLLSEEFGGEWEDSPPPVRHQLLNAAEQFPDKLALACLHQPADLYDFQSLTDSHLQWSYAQLSAAADILSAGLQAYRISSGSSIATVLGNGAEFGLSFWAAHKIGCPFVPLNPQILSNATEARHMLVVANVTAVILGNVESAAKFDALYYPSQRTILKVVVGEPTISGWISFSDLLAAGRKYASFDGEISYSPLAPTYEPDSTVSTLRLPTVDEIVTVLFTSGTTSLPKGCPHTNRTLNAFMKNLALGGSSPNDIFCGVLPNNHAMGYFFALYFFCQGGAVVYPSASFDSARMVEALIIHSCTHTCLVPTALHSLLDRAEGSGLTFPMLHDVLLAGSSITPHNLRQIVHNLGSRAVSTGFGMTEGSPVWTAATSDPETLIVGDDTISGRASPGVHLRICTPGSTHALPRGQPGEVHESGPGVITGYLGNNVGSDSFYVDKEARKWFKTGDQAVMHRDGRVSIVGR
jgi:acyl-CoA synthetase (AMP-forming)/AMP-acid ligase II